MPLHELPGIVRRSKRVGRGIGSRGAKSGRGQKGQRSRAGSHHKAGFEGGQTPLYMRLPKGRGVKQTSPSRVQKPAAISLSDLGRFTAGSIVGPGQLRKAGLLPRHAHKVKLLATGSVERSLTVRVHAVTSRAREQVEAAGGKVEIILSAA